MFWEGTANDLKRKIDKGDKSLKTKKAYENALKQKEIQIKEGNSTLHNVSPKNWQSFRKEAEQELIENSKKYRDINSPFKNNLGGKMKNVLSGFKTNWDKNKSKFSTTYETSPLSVGAQSSIKSVFISFCKLSISPI